MPNDSYRIDGFGRLVATRGGPIPPSDEQVINALRAAEPPGMRRLRWLLAIAYAGPRLYRDDGEYSDPASGIDFRRDSVELIERKMQAFAKKQWREAQHAEPNAQAKAP